MPPSWPPSPSKIREVPTCLPHTVHRLDTTFAISQTRPCISFLPVFPCLTSPARIMDVCSVLAAMATLNSRRSDLANEHIPMFQPNDNDDDPVIPAPSMRRRGSGDLEELGMEIRKLQEEVDSMDANANMMQQQQQQQQRRTERVVETRRKVTTTRTKSSMRTYEGA